MKNILSLLLITIFSSQLAFSQEMAFENDGSDNYAVTDNAVMLGNTSNITLSTWVKIYDFQTPPTGILMTTSGTGSGVHFHGTKNRIHGHWDNVHYTIDGSPFPSAPINQWTHVVLVVEPNLMRLYIDGVEFVRNDPFTTVDFNQPFFIGNDRAFSGRSLNGQMDEVRFYDRSLSKEEVRQLRHLHNAPVTNGLVTHYNFNEAIGQPVLDLQGNTNASFVGTESRVISTAPANNGVVDFQNVSSSGTFSFISANATLTIGTGTTPNGDIYVNHLDASPNNLPTNINALGNQYWIINNYGANASFTGLDEISFSALPIGDYESRAYTLYHRLANSDLSSDWTAISTANAVNVGQEGTVTFNNVTAFGQFFIAYQPYSYPVCESSNFIKYGNSGTTRVWIQWNKNPNADLYQLRYRPVGSSTWLKKSRRIEYDNVRLSNLQVDTDYEGEFRTRCSGVWEDYVPFSFSTKSITCEPINTGVAFGFTNDRIRLAWQTVNNADRYQIEYRPFGQTNWQRKTCFDSERNLLGLMGNTTYEFRLRVRCNGSTYENWGELGVFTTPDFAAVVEDEIGLRAEEINNQLEIYPNPVQDVMTIVFPNQGKEATLRIFNTNGQELLQKTIIDYSKTEISTQGLPNALYVIEIHQKGQAPIKRLVSVIK